VGPEQSQPSPLFNSGDTRNTSTLLPNNSLPIAIADAIGLPKSYRNLPPVVRYLIETQVK
jgi:hypothetical protein